MCKTTQLLQFPYPVYPDLRKAGDNTNVSNRKASEGIFTCRKPLACHSPIPSAWKLLPWIVSLVLALLSSFAALYVGVFSPLLVEVSWLCFSHQTPARWSHQGEHSDQSKNGVFLLAHSLNQWFGNFEFLSGWNQYNQQKGLFFPRNLSIPWNWTSPIYDVKYKLYYTMGDIPKIDWSFLKR